MSAFASSTANFTPLPNMALNDPCDPSNPVAPEPFSDAWIPQDGHPRLRPSVQRKTYPSAPAYMPRLEDPESVDQISELPTDEGGQPDFEDGVKDGNSGKLCARNMKTGEAIGGGRVGAEGCSCVSCGDEQAATRKGGDIKGGRVFLSLSLLHDSAAQTSKMINRRSLTRARTYSSRQAFGRSDGNAE